MLGILEGKTWGKTQCLFARNNVEVHRIKVVKNGFCSEHTHKSKYNHFYVESGRLVVKVFRDSGVVDATILGPGMSTIVKPGEKHQFIAKETTVAYEIYYVVLEDNDITRYTQGGVKNAIGTPDLSRQGDGTKP